MHKQGFGEFIARAVVIGSQISSRASTAKSFAQLFASLIIPDCLTFEISTMLNVLYTFKLFYLDPRTQRLFA